MEHFQRRHQKTLGRPLQARSGNVELGLSALGDGLDDGAVIRDQGPGIRQEAAGQRRRLHLDGIPGRADVGRSTGLDG